MAAIEQVLNSVRAAVRHALNGTADTTGATKASIEDAGEDAATLSNKHAAERAMTDTLPEVVRRCIR